MAIGVDDVSRCGYCGKVLQQECLGLGYCNGRCLDKKRAEARSSKDVEKEVAVLMKQFDEGGWKP